MIIEVILRDRATEHYRGEESCFEGFCHRTRKDRAVASPSAIGVKRHGRVPAQGPRAFAPE